MKVTVGFAVAACCVLGYFCGQSEAFECYVCSSLLSSDCADPFSSGSKVDNCAMCGKNKAKAGDTEASIVGRSVPYINDGSSNTITGTGNGTRLGSGSASTSIVSVTYTNGGSSRAITGTGVVSGTSGSSGQSEAFECYVCSSLFSSDCADPFSSGSKVDNCVMCSNTKVTTGDIKMVARTCLPNATGFSPGCTSNSAGGVSTDNCYCNSALCNASTRASMTTALLFLMPAFLWCLNNL